MQLTIKVIPNARKAKIVDDGVNLKVYVNAPAADNKANKAVIKALAAHYGVRKSAIHIISGVKSREKRIQINIPQ
ncbi:MAG TPA: DUF167 domain-containing protein [Flavobacteriales bacterium]|jgi:hypothetical protein|nr:DUF167 domain-containing protein [Flavobacteriales bacterium]HIO73405.1 DUF167 domain-containing protein [Flavobacteriales bacterium]